MKNKGKFEELAKTKIQDRRNIVISSFEDESNNGFTIAQQVEVEEGSKRFCMFMKESIHIDNLEGLIAIRDAINLAIGNYKEKIEKEAEDDEMWD